MFPWRRRRNMPGWRDLQTDRSSAMDGSRPRPAVAARPITTSVRCGCPEPEDHAAAALRLKQPVQPLDHDRRICAGAALDLGLDAFGPGRPFDGENTAARRARVMSFEDCVGRASARHAVRHGSGFGGMLSVPMAGRSGAAARRRARSRECNAPALLPARGPQALDARRTTGARGIECQRKGSTSRRIPGCWSRSGPVRRLSARSCCTLRRYPSSRTGPRRFITEAEAKDQDYWVGHLRGTVRFVDCITTPRAEPGRIACRDGPGQGLELAHPCAWVWYRRTVCGSALRHPDEVIADDAYFPAGLRPALGGRVAPGLGTGLGARGATACVADLCAFQRSRLFIAPGKALTTCRRTVVAQRRCRAWGWRPSGPRSGRICEIDVEAGLENAEPPELAGLHG